MDQMKILPGPDSSRTGPRALVALQATESQTGGKWCAHRMNGDGAVVTQRRLREPGRRGNVQEILDASRIAADVDLRVAGLEISSLSLGPARPHRR